MKKNKKLKIILISLLCVVAICCAGFGVYVSDYYRANDTALAATFSDNEVTVIEKNNDCMVFTPKNPERGMVFYPGGKVEYTAYAPLMKELAREGFFCVLVKMPFNLAVFDINAADDVISEYTNIDEWYIAGHSLGGAMAASYASKNSDKLEGLILLAAYSTEDLTDSGLNVIQIQGREDGLFWDDMEEVKKYQPNLPDDFSQLCIEGGCHAYFGSYGEQEGDGKPTITPEEQVRQTVEFITENLQEGE
ncbi:MAG: alpha/beta fold hydrolase [Acutalibacteraceae bacterium]|nr:alpha/beta fold hydrolase [Acutalibacteraceae bacterium]